jgi:hypothetical protein
MCSITLNNWCFSAIKYLENIICIRECKKSKWIDRKKFKSYISCKNKNFKVKKKSLLHNSVRAYRYNCYLSCAFSNKSDKFLKFI